MTKLSQTGRELGHALAALAAGGSGALGTLECRVASLQQDLLAMPATTLADIEARLQVMRALIASLGEPGYLLQLIDATLRDLNAMRNARDAGGEPVAAVGADDSSVPPG
jgi:hypothetical protein